MLTQRAEDHFALHLLLLVILGITFGLMCTYLISLILAIYEITKITFSVFSLSGGA
jgi:hypothetical protein